MVDLTGPLTPAGWQVRHVNGRSGVRLALASLKPGWAILRSNKLAEHMVDLTRPLT